MAGCPKGRWTSSRFLRLGCVVSLPSAQSRCPCPVEAHLPSFAGSHGLWPTPGEHTYARALSFSLIDSTSYGIRWPLDNLQILPYFAPYQGRSRRYRRRFEGDQTWANFLGRWGDNGSRKCWWWGVWKECGLVDGPRGPLRDSETWPPTVRPPSSETCSQPFRLSL